MATVDLTWERLKQVLYYDPDTGLFLWRWRDPNESQFSSYRSGCVWNARYAFKQAGGKNKTVGYISIGIDGCHHWAHRLAWFYVHGTWPSDQIDHKDTDGFNNKLTNLRDATPQINAQNHRRAHKHATVQLLGVYFESRKAERPFTAAIRIGKKRKHLGYFDTAEDAHAAYVAEKRRVHAGCTI